MKRSIKVYKSFDEQKEDEVSYAKKLTPAERIENVVKLIKRIHNYSKKKPSTKKITILFYQ